MPAPRGRRRELVEEREIARPRRDRASPPRYGLGRELPPGTASRPRDGAKLHSEHANVARRPMPSPGRLASVLLRRHVPVRTRFDLLRAEARRRIRPKTAYALRYGSGQSSCPTPTMRSTGSRSSGSSPTRRIDRLRGCGRARSRSAQGVLRGPCARARSAQRDLVRAGDGEPRAPRGPPSLLSCAWRRLADSRVSRRTASEARRYCTSWRDPGRTRCIPLTRGRSTRSAPARAGRGDGRHSRRGRVARRATGREGEHRGRGVRDRARHTARGLGAVSELFVEMHEWAPARRRRAHRAPRAGRIQGASDPDGAVLRLRREEAPRSGSTYRSQVSSRSTVVRALEPSARAWNSSPAHR